MDEATSALDYDTERRVCQIWKALMVAVFSSLPTDYRLFEMQLDRNDASGCNR